MKTKLVSSTDAQNNFGQILDDVVRNGTQYVVRRRNSSQAVILSIADFERILAASQADRSKLEKLIKELSPNYTIGEPIEGD
ncbi:MAG: type II toxin-antitoxin system Phd/YefM family antitoxin [Chloroflexi bacterium]|nr:type II toxin-antitoxin system Phd/YefM family antitoxin [Chloroflexota bacterium]